ncbi:MAG: DNA translocase FtsK [Chloroflexi bacterium]|nr:MAG: DNA translocase FtsK [Chloroflexota bacterium]
MSNRRSTRRRTTRRRRQTNNFRISGRVAREALALLLVLLAIVSTIALFAPTAGAIVKPWHDLLAYLLGWGIAFAPPLLAGFALMLWMRTMPAERWMAATGAALVALALLGAFHLAAGGGMATVRRHEGGGVIGYGVSAVLAGAIGGAGAWVVLSLLLVVGLLLYFNMTVGDLVAAYLQQRDDRDERETRASAEAARRAPVGPGRLETNPSSDLAHPGLLTRMREALVGGSDDDEPPVIVRRQRAEPGDGRRAPAQPIAMPVPEASMATAVATPELAIEGDGEGEGEGAPDASIGVVPVAEEVNDAALERIVRSWELGIKVARIQEGPVVTQYALDVEPGIKLSRIEGLADNLALALSARSIRIEAPIPGEPFVGIEIPNSAFDLVTLKEVLASRNFDDLGAQSKLAFALGQDVAGQPFSADLSRMPHVLIAGATGSGKSVCVNAIICSLLMRADPTEVKLLLIDPKRVEMAQYKGLPHLLSEVIVDTDKAVNALKWTVGAMESRYHEFAQRGVRNIAGYNAQLRAGEPRMPYIVVVIDELADLMMVSAYEVEATVTRIAQLARATGIHLVVATQRPSVQVITGLIKANIPSRIAFAMTSGIDSRTILDTTGAEDLLGRGDMLYQPIDAPRAVRLQGVLVTDGEIEGLARHWRAQGGPHYRPEITAARRDGRGGGQPGEDDEEASADPLLRQAIEVVRRNDKASASLLQRRLRIGYARAARMLDQMEDRGIVGPADGSRFREVMVTSDGWGAEMEPDEEDR